MLRAWLGIAILIGVLGPAEGATSDVSSSEQVEEWMKVLLYAEGCSVHWITPGAIRQLGFACGGTACQDFYFFRDGRRAYRLQCSDARYLMGART